MYEYILELLDFSLSKSWMESYGNKFECENEENQGVTKAKNGVKPNIFTKHQKVLGACLLCRFCSTRF